MWLVSIAPWLNGKNAQNIHTETWRLYTVDSYCNLSYVIHLNLIWLRSKYFASHYVSCNTFTKWILTLLLSLIKVIQYLHAFVLTSLLSIVASSPSICAIMITWLIICFFLSVICNRWIIRRQLSKCFIQYNILFLCQWLPFNYKTVTVFK